MTMRIRLAKLFICVAVFTSSLVGITNAATLYWSGNGTTQGGAGTWDTTLTRWGAVPAGPYSTAWNNANNDTAVFASTAGAVTLGANVTVGGLTFNTAGYSIAPGAGPYSITFGVPGNIDVSTGTTTISAAIAGSAITKTGGGQLTLSGTNSYTGGTTLSGGTLATTADANLGGAGGITVTASTTWNTGGNSSVTYIRDIAINAGTLTMTSGNAGKTFQGSLTGSGTLFVNHSTSFIFTNASNFTGAIRANTANSASYGLDMYSLRDEAGDGTISLENGSFRWFGSGGTKTFNDRQFFLGSSSGGSIYNRSTDNSAIVITTNLGQSGTGTRTLTLGGNNSASGTFSGNIGNNGANAVSVTKTEGNVWALGGTNTYSGVTNLAASGTTGILVFQGSQSLSPNTSLVFAQSSSNVQSARFLDDGAGTIVMDRPISFGGTNTTQNLNLFVGNNNTANLGSSSGTTTGSTIEVGAITFTSVASDTNTTTVNVTGANGYRLLTDSITLNNLVSRTAGQTTVTALNPTSANMTVGAITMANGNTGIANDGIPVLRLTGTATDNYVTGTISNAADYLTGQPLSVQKQGTGTWTLEGNNTFSGGLAATAGVLNINHAGALGTGTFTIGALASFNNTSGGAITNANNNIIAWNGDTTFSASNDLDLGTGNVTLGGNRIITITNAPGVLTFGGNISGAFGITKGGGGTMALTATNSGYTGATTISQGTLIVNSLADYSANSSIGAPASGNIQLGSTTLTGTLNYAGSGSSSNRTITVGSNTAGANAGGGVINNNGTGALTFTAVTFNSGLASVNTARSLTLGGATTGFVNEIQGIIQNNAAAGLINLVKNGNSTWALGGSNSYTGTTSINGGTLLVNGNQTSATGAVSVNNSAILGGTGIIGGAVTVNDTAFIAPGNSPGGLELASTFNLTSTATLSVEIAGDNFTLNGLEEYDRLKVTGATTLSGLLSVSLISGWTLGANEYYGIVDAVGGRTGVFANYAEGDTVLTNSGYFLKITYNGVVADSGTPSITGGNDVVLYTVAVPEPSSLAMLAFGMITLWLFRKKKV